MSFLDEQATGQIGIGEKANLSTLTRRKRKRKKGQNPTGAETYSLMPQDEFSNIVSSPTDIQQVGIGNLLQAQGSSAGEVPNVFEQYDSAAPVLGTKEAVYYQPPEEEEEEEEEEDLPSVEDDPMRDFSVDASQAINPGFTTDDGQVGTGDKDFESATAMIESVKNAFLGAARNTTKSFKENLPPILGGQKPFVANQAISTVNGDQVETGRAADISNAALLDAAAAREQSVANANARKSSGTSQQIPGSVSVDFSIPAGPGDDAGAMDGFDWSAPSAIDSIGVASGGVITKSKSKNKNSFMSMKGK